MINNNRSGQRCKTDLLSIMILLVLLLGVMNGVMLVLLDLSVAFDTIDHDNLFFILEKICRNLW